MEIFGELPHSQTKPHRYILQNYFFIWQGSVLEYFIVYSMILSGMTLDI